MSRPQTTGDSGLWITVNMAAEKVRVHPDTIRRWVARGIVPAVRIPSGRIRVDSRSLTSESLFVAKVDRILASIW